MVPATSNNQLTGNAYTSKFPPSLNPKEREVEREGQENVDQQMIICNTQAKKKSKFTVTKSMTGLQGASAVSGDETADAVSISFLSSISDHNTSNSNDKDTTIRQPAKQVIQRALARLRPGGVFFVLDYKEDSNSQRSSGNNTETAPPTPSPSPPPPTSKAIKEIPEDLLQKWNLTMVPTNLENYYSASASRSSRFSPTTSNTASSHHHPRNSLPLPGSLSASKKRIVRWMGTKPRQAD